MGVTIETSTGTHYVRGHVHVLTIDVLGRQVEVLEFFDATGTTVRVPVQAITGVTGVLLDEDGAELAQQHARDEAARKTEREETAAAIEAVYTPEYLNSVPSSHVVMARWLLARILAGDNRPGFEYTIFNKLETPGSVHLALLDGRRLLAAMDAALRGQGVDLDAELAKLDAADQEKARRALTWAR